MPTGEAQMMTYKPGERRPQEKIPDAGEAQLKVVKFGKAGPNGWKVKAGKYPNRMVTCEVQDTDDGSGAPLQVRFWILPHPQMMRGVWDFIAAVKYPEELSLPVPKSPKDTAAIQAACEKLDEVLQHAVDSETVFRVELAHEDFNNETQARIKRYLGDDEVAEDDGGEEAEEETEESEETEEAEPEEEKPAPKVKAKPAPAAKGGKKK